MANNFNRQIKVNNLTIVDILHLNEGHISNEKDLENLVF